MVQEDLRLKETWTDSIISTYPEAFFGVGHNKKDRLNFSSKRTNWNFSINFKKYFDFSIGFIQLSILKRKVQYMPNTKSLGNFCRQVLEINVSVEHLKSQKSFFKKFKSREIYVLVISHEFHIISHTKVRIKQ